MTEKGMDDIGGEGELAGNYIYHSGSLISMADDGGDDDDFPKKKKS